MKVIGFEEHYKLPAISDVHNETTASAMDLLITAGYGRPGSEGEWPPGVNDLGEGRIAAMDDAGIDVQILSHSVPGPEMLEPSVAVGLARQANDAVAAAIAKYPDRFRGFATLPMRDPAAAADELERVVGQQGFVGALITHRGHDRRAGSISARGAQRRRGREAIPGAYLHHPRRGRRRRRAGADPDDVASRRIGRRQRAFGR